VRNRRELNASLKGATLGDPDGDVEDTLKWLKKSKKKEKELAKKRQEELENMDKMFQGQSYTEGKRPVWFVLGQFKELVSKQMILSGSRLATISMNWTKEKLASSR
jgi:U4/U6.U5 tri-snRNP-associated protein 1